MHYYQHHIGDFIKDTANLDDHQLATYLRMLWAYYTDEKPFANELEDLAFAMRSDEKTVRLLLRHFFNETSDGWRHNRCDREIAEYHSKSEKARKSANARWSNAPSMRTHSERNADAKVSDANQEPITKNHKEEPNGSVGKADRLPACEYDAVVSLYHEVLPELPSVRVMNDSRKRVMQSRWRWVLTSKKSDGTRRAETAQEALEWLRQFFTLARDNDFVMGRGWRDPKHAAWQADLEYLLSDRGLKQVVEKTRGGE